jgi:DNA-binding NarL/FixJ family response regulator
MTEQLGELKPDVVVLDAQQSAVDALATLHRLRADAPTVRILVFSSPESVEFGVLCLCTGASGYLSKDIDMSALGRIVRGLGRGETVVSRALATELIARLREAQPRPSQHPRPALSASERRLLELLRTGHSIAEAAAQLGVAESTIRRRLASARRKLLPRGSDDGGRVRISSRTQPHSRSEES